MNNKQEIERSIITKFRKTIWRQFIKAVRDYEMIKENDKIAVCISGGKDSMLLAKCLEENGKIDDVKGIAYINKSGKFIKNEKMEPITDLDNIPFAAELINKYLDPRDYFFAASSS